MYIELDLVAGKVENINEKTVLEGRKEEKERRVSKYLLNKYNISKQTVKDVLLKKGSSTEKTLPSGERFRKSWRNSETDSEASESEDSEASESESDTSKADSEKQVKKEEEVVIGSDGEVFFDHDFGFFGAILACYNNHWVLKTSPDDWWNVIVR